MNIDSITGSITWLGVCIIGGVLSGIFQKGKDMKYDNCKECAYCEYHDEVTNGAEYKGYYCGGFDYLTDKAKLENIDECEYAD